MNRRIFQIGYSKTGTVSLYRFFLMNGVPSIHYDYGKLARQIAERAVAGGELLEGYDKVTGFFDMEAWLLSGAYEGFAHFDKLDEQYPGSRFILNWRPAENWLRSARNHAHDSSNMLAIMKRNLGLNEAQLLARRDRHHQRVIEYFLDRPKDLLVFNIETDGGDKLCRFFRDLYPNLNAAHWRKWNSTARKNKFLRRPGSGGPRVILSSRRRG